MTRSPEIYTPGYAEPTLRLMLQRNAAKHAAFFTPYLRGGMCVLDCGCGPATITLDLAKLVSPGQVVGIDLEPNQLRSAQDRSRHKELTHRLAWRASTLSRSQTVNLMQSSPTRCSSIFGNLLEHFQK
jgi:cyclopropane fatty-acyl-phospholipid synthase-like methyltransferase